MPGFRCCGDRMNCVDPFQGRLNNKSLARFACPVFFFFLLGLQSKLCGLVGKRKTPALSCQGSVVAGIGFEPMTFGL